MKFKLHNNNKKKTNNNKIEINKKQYEIHKKNDTYLNRICFCNLNLLKLKIIIFNLKEIKKMFSLKIYKAYYNLINFN